MTECPEMTDLPGTTGHCRARADIETESLPAHVALCRERYGTLNRRLLRLEILYGGLVTSLAAIAVRLWTGD
ncbi:MAG: hypothetical protein MI785_23145 [Kiloniellales bacterium]|nr:hypothetical protein [Kiloniellales bacterium]